MDKKIKDLEKRKLELEKSLSSYDLVYPPPDHKKIADNLISDIDDLIYDIHLENILDEIKDVKYVWTSSGIRRQYRKIYE